MNAVARLITDLCSSRRTVRDQSLFHAVRDLPDGCIGEVAPRRPAGVIRARPK
ncbi:hypothetical protein ACFWUP_11240 [Nocardia sp. NPDC058658]|uniref:hypothetical protein n=1 Tax=Nocardia sp. NPDC058658 TaxID=3346580 RepID=UPI00364DF461